MYPRKKWLPLWSRHQAVAPRFSSMARLPLHLETAVERVQDWRGSAALLDYWFVFQSLNPHDWCQLTGKDWWVLSFLGASLTGPNYELFEVWFFRGCASCRHSRHLSVCDDSRPCGLSDNSGGSQRRKHSDK